MKTVEDIKHAIVQLTVGQRVELAAWLHELDDQWDRQMVMDAKAGKFGCLIAGAKFVINPDRNSHVQAS